MAGAIVYYGTYGSTKQHAEWIAEETGFALYDQKIDYTPLQGRMIFRKLKPMHRLMMRIGKMIQKDPKQKAGMLKDVDGVDRASIAPLVAKVTGRQ